MQKIKKIQAFTVNEMLVVLLLTTIVVGMGFAVLQLVQQQMGGIDRNYGRNTQLNLLRQSLWMDFNQSDGVWYDAKTRQLLFSNEIKEVTYQFLDDKVVKDIDTFQVIFKEKQFFFKGALQKEGEIDALNFSSDKKKGSQRLFVYKTNAATSSVNE
ncbi:MAG: hypothetical protein AAF039_16530 [Bacteroidota bacterium]